MSYLSKNQRYTLLKLNNDFKNLESVKENIFSRTYVEPLSVKSIPEDTSDEKNFFSKWTNITEIENINFDETEIALSYVKATALCEYSTRRVFDEATGELLPKEERLNTSNIDVIFVNEEDDLYIIIFSIGFYDLRRVTRLIGEKYIEPLTSKHQTKSDLFHWLFYRQIKENLNLSDDITLDNINGFTGTVINEENLFEGTSIQTTELIITKAFITNGYPITSIKIDLQMSLASVSFYLNEISNGKELKIVVQKNSTVPTIMNAEDIEYQLPIYVFFYLIPEIISLYKKEEVEFLSKERTSFLSEIGVEVIKTIMAKNSIEIDDIS
ncbi:hypothetical protein SAMN04488100_13128 [Alkalibacterium putridalgicola]|uniref:Uncharacterized protein n=1 Tax=Alkalibacterium putridalgicola TaxID=426703 RepID=A0A1H7W8P6_9LACT|nr:hypothetical protein [Alkalibacterium putridalgicola]GEK89985.1 hypothetical protein APU01nite_20240 [Alkalibacterium putridalgicola]SEM17459.1 hypothetical protein SAMN04488100_13128 [Alkalibacterium putridalgicola]